MDHSEVLVLELEEFRRLRNIFNPFKVLDNAGREETHSRMLAWLLDPHGSHQLGDAFGRGLLQCSEVCNLSSLVVERERKIVVNRNGTRVERRIDVFATLPSEKVGWLIELKTFSHEHDDQLADYEGGSRQRANTEASNRITST